MSDWQPIETAPKDREVLFAGAYERSGAWEITVGRWVVYRNSWPYVGERFPSHWMPLPATPNTTDTEE